MAPINISTITFIPDMEFTFGSFNFIADVDGRLHIFDPEATRIGQIAPNSTDRVVIIRPVFEPDSDQLKSGIILPRYKFGFCNSANTFQHMLSQIMEDQTERNTNMGECGRADSIIHPTYDEC